ncbi:hypothetical protein, variant [Loa loa]|uniref:Uncharacterized protein n=1 Tax=Loa loa TaxID=7209 RepID=A0A1S0UL23_LOALO|nr:hypothetical protein, variant [Loa loa]EJD76243.1 hypothetical protein, variant [Loa loa]
MLYKGLITKLKNEFLYVWSKSFGGEAVLDKRMVPTNRSMPSVGDWIVFSIKDDSNFVDDFIDIPDLLSTKLNGHGDVVVKTRISFRSSDISGCNLLAHSNDLGVVGIFQNFPNLNESYDYEVWVERIPQAFSNLERLYKTSWYISEGFPEQIVGTSLERYSSVRSLPSEHSSSMELPNGIFGGSCSDIATHTTKSSFSSGDIDSDELKEYNQLRGQSFSKQSYFTEQQFLYSQPCASTEGTQGEKMKKSKAVVGLVTSSLNGAAFIWSSALGRGMLSLCFGEQIRHGEWIKFIPSSLSDIYLQGHNELGRCKYIAKDWCIVNPVYPTRSYRTIVSVTVPIVAIR